MAEKIKLMKILNTHFGNWVANLSRIYKSKKEKEKKKEKKKTDNICSVFIRELRTKTTEAILK